VAWDHRHAMRLAEQGMWAQRLLRTKLRGVSGELAARVEVLIVEKRAAYEARNMKRYEEAIQAMVHHARTL
jgi:non-ribosomal peptide synthetase component E (peptide arylation enzyme)